MFMTCPLDVLDEICTIIIIAIATLNNYWSSNSHRAGKGFIAVISICSVLCALPCSYPCPGPVYWQAAPAAKVARCSAPTTLTGLAQYIISFKQYHFSASSIFFSSSQHNPAVPHLLHLSSKSLPPNILF